jgi:Phospholipase_D-nuclease N-terminal
MGRLIVLFALAYLAVTVVALIDCLSTEGRIRGLPRALWAVIILFVPLIGPAAWFLAGRPARPADPAATPLLPPLHRVIAPDDDPDFLRDVDRRRLGDEEEMLRLWEADLRKREEDPRKPDDEPPGSGEVR